MDRIEEIRARLAEFDAILPVNGARVWSKDPEFTGNAVGYIRHLLAEFDAAEAEVVRLTLVGAESWVRDVCNTAADNVRLKAENAALREGLDKVQAENESLRIANELLRDPRSPVPVRTGLVEAPWICPVCRTVNSGDMCAGCPRTREEAFADGRVLPGKPACCVEELLYFLMTEMVDPPTILARIAGRLSNLENDCDGG